MKIFTILFLLFVIVSTGCTMIPPTQQIHSKDMAKIMNHGRATSVLILAIRGQNRLANARLCLPQPSSSPHQLRHA
ncbi:MAG: hypothetical protein GY782_05750 [Gammaproteobacteria bacterium]|nr:hypothetical protein [Gammaproteobacteria bacterium]